MVRLGITGGIAMGKSTCAALLRERGLPVVDTDDLARELVRPGQSALAEIIAAFGCNVLAPSGELHRPALAAIVFADASARRRLEAILHPPIQRAWQAELARLAALGTRAAAVVIPLLYETAAESHFDAVLCVACSGAEQQKRLAQRGWAPAEAQARLAAQWPVADKLARARFAVWTDGSLAAHAGQLNRILMRAVPPAI